MKRKLFLVVILVLTVVFAGLAAVASAAPKLPRFINDNDPVRLRGNIHVHARPEFDQGVARSFLMMERMILTLELSPEKQAEVDTFLAEVHDPASSNYRRWLTPEEFGERFGPDIEDINTVSRWLQSHGFVVEEVAKGRTWINFSGTAASVERAFRTKIHEYYVDGRLHHANVENPSVPKAFAGLVSGVVSLHDFPRKMMNNGHYPVTQAALMPAYTNGSSHYLSPGDFSTIYNVNVLYNEGIDGSGQSIAIVGRTHPSSANWATFRSMMGLPANPPEIIVNGPDPGDLGENENAEADLDVEWSGAVAKNATVLFVISKSTSSSDGVDLSAQYIVNNNLSPVMSTSFGACESELGTAANNFYRNLWQQAAAQGITSFVASGDSGAAGCNSGNDTSGSGLGINGLASTPYNVAVGGTQFNEGSGTYWNTSNGSGYTSAISYIPEAAWNESGSVSGGSGLWSTGGGVSLRYGKPVWQVAPGVPPDNRRDIPDVSLTASAHDAYLVVTRGGLYAISGTSASSPAFAGIMALIVQKTGQRQGNANSRFYQLGNAQYSGSGAAVFHDTTSGTNSVPGVTGYSAATGYDLATGLGSVDAHALVNNWTPDFTISAFPAALSVPQGTVSTTTISTSTSGNFSNAVSLSCSGLPTGVTAAFNPPAITTPNSGSSVLTIIVGASSPAGTYPILVTGNGGSMTHSAAVFLAITPVFVTTASVSNGTGGTISPSEATVAPGGSVTFTIIPTVGYHLATLTDNGANVTASVVGGIYTINDVTASHTIVAAFVMNMYSIQAVSTGNGSITPMSVSANYGASVPFTITPDSGYTLSGLTNNGVAVTAVENPLGTFSYTINNISDDHTVQASFSLAAAIPVPAIGLWGSYIAVFGLLVFALRRRR